VAGKIIEISMRIVQFAMFDFRRVTPSHDLEKKKNAKRKSSFLIYGTPRKHAEVGNLALMGKKIQLVGGGSSHESWL